MLLYSFLIILFIDCSCRVVEAGLNNFTSLISVDEWLIERKVDLNNNEIKCRASLPANATWFGARVRIGSNDQLIVPISISVEEKQITDSRLIKIKKLLNDCRSGFLFLPDNPK